MNIKTLKKVAVLALASGAAMGSVMFFPTLLGAIIAFIILGVSMLWAS